jgi:hypothetical protein
VLLASIASNACYRSAKLPLATDRMRVERSNQATELMRMIMPFAPAVRYDAGNPAAA